MVSQLHSTKKHKDELRKARRGSQPSQQKTESPAASGRDLRDAEWGTVLQWSQIQIQMKDHDVAEAL